MSDNPCNIFDKMGPGPHITDVIEACDGCSPKPLVLYSINNRSSLVTFTNIACSGSSRVVNSVITTHSVLADAVGIRFGNLLRHRARFAVMVRRFLRSMAKVVNLATLTI